MKSINAKQLKELRGLLEEQYGYTDDFSFVVFERAEQKYYIVTRDAEYLVEKKIRLERVGVYFGQLAHGELRFSIEGSQLIGPGATKHVLTLTTQQRDEWMLGKDIPLDGAYDQAFYIVKSGSDFLGCGKYKNGTLQNYVPKERYVGALFTDDDIIETK